MSENNPFGFAKLVPGFDFLQNLSKGASQSLPQMPSLSSWIAPTLNVEELDRRINELKAVQFWLEQNRKALSATIQALEVQKMTLATLQGMNFNMGELAKALQLKPAEAAAAAVGARKAREATEASADSARRNAPGPDKAAAEPHAGNGAAAGAVDPLQWWGALTQQFQEIAANAMKDVAEKTAANTARNMAAGAAQDAAKAKAATSMIAAAPAKAPAAKKSPARKKTARS